MQKIAIKIYITFFLFLSFSLQAFEEEETDLFQLSLSSLMNVKVTTASGIEESLSDAPAAMVVIEESDFKKRGYISLVEVLADLPGFDSVVTSGATHLTFYQRGYRTPASSRTLFMINGVIDNHLWTQIAVVSRQYPISNIARVEVLYGPSSVRYGPNAFMGVINIITKNADDFTKRQYEITARAELGRWNSKGIEISANGRFNDLRYSFSARKFSSDEEDLSNRWGFLSNDLYQSETIWGPIRDLNVNGNRMDHYSDPTVDIGIVADVTYQNYKLGLIHWKVDEGYGAQYAADRGQANSSWKQNSNQLYVEHQGNVNQKLSVKSLGLYRDNRIWGNWAEAEPDFQNNMNNTSFISFTHWNTTSEAIELTQDAEYHLNERWNILTGWRYKKSDVTKAYDIPGYWSGSYSSTTPTSDLGPYGQGAGIFHSTDEIYTFNEHPLNNVPDDNRQNFSDKGLYMGGIYDVFPWIFNVGLRFDDNSIWGKSASPRLSGIYKLANEKTVFKLIYGEAFQEPSAEQLYGGWSGRKSNLNLSSEKAKNIELILMQQEEHWLHELSLYVASYKNVIRESAINDGSRDIWGAEYRGRFEYPNFLDQQDKITGNFYYTYTDPQTNRRYEHEINEWISDDARVGDIAPHKINASVYFPLNNHFGLNFKSNYYSPTDLYSRNPLSEQGIKLGSRFLFDIAANYTSQYYSISIKVNNLFDHQHMLPGIKAGDSGNDFTQRSLGFTNSLIPQNSRSVWLTLESYL
jgi:outer membrane receptor for ferrienterochelin and colicins